MPDDGCYVVLAGEVQMWEVIQKDEKAFDFPEFLEGSAILKRHARGILSLLEEEDAPIAKVKKSKRKQIAGASGDNVG